ncbi:hypothetical protein AJ80_07413 [Polytolypa hystricis UAMH7299]|uniref:C2H2-type domain-containing protein n=1 Tax=Polytolypa hystricis (strain UAMH7299) TaxID=1447883 RepID=A0A2B7XPR3_POLH7|nr:hypothetical protein AJ80_07413 [Polytolypa hystricis UAMH7299]
MVDLRNYITRDTSYGTEYECAYCSKTCQSLHALYQHCMMSSMHAWCHRCDRLFRNEDAKRAHIKNSLSHHVCGECDDDFTTLTGLERHREEVHCICSVCNQEFKNYNNLRMSKCDMKHKQVHLSRNIECYGSHCYRTFPSFSAMLVHLESGSCSSGTSCEDLFDIAGGEWSRDDFMDPFDSHEPYCCPECRSWFRHLSSLYQHIEHVPSCSGHLRSGGVLLDLQGSIYWNVP